MSETTALTPAQEAAYRHWLQANRITNADHPDAHYDMRGFWQATKGAPHPPGSEQHFPDTFKQHGHPTFSQESQYSAGPFDGGRWTDGPSRGVDLGPENYVPNGADLLMSSRGTTKAAPIDLRLALLSAFR